MSTSLLKQPNTVKAVAGAVLGAVLFGAEIGYWGQATSMVSFNRAMTGSVDIEPSGGELAFITCTLYIVGTIFALPPVTRIFAGGLGRRKTIMISGVLFAIAMAMQAASANISYPASKSLLWAGRAVLGVPVAFVRLLFGSTIHNTNLNRSHHANAHILIVLVLVLLCSLSRLLQCF